MKRLEYLLAGFITGITLATCFVIVDTIIHMPTEAEPVCRSESGHKHLPCPETNND